MEPVAIVAKVKISKTKVHQFFDDYKSEIALEIDKIMKENYGDVFIMQYNEETQSLYFIYWLELRNPNDMENTKGFQIFKNIANYKDIDTVDYAAFSSSAPNFITDPIWVTYKIMVGNLEKFDLNEIPEENMNDLEQVLMDYIFTPAESEDFDNSDYTNPYCMFLNETSIHKTLLDEYKKIANQSPA